MNLFQFKVRMKILTKWSTMTLTIGRVYLSHNRQSMNGWVNDVSARHNANFTHRNHSQPKPIHQPIILLLFFPFYYSCFETISTDNNNGRTKWNGYDMFLFVLFLRFVRFRTKWTEKRETLWDFLSQEENVDDQLFRQYTIRSFQVPHLLLPLELLLYHDEKSRVLMAN